MPSAVLLVAPSRRAALGLAAFALAGCSSRTTTGPGPNPGTTPPVATCTFTNPVLNGADPSVARRNGQYYLVQSHGRGIRVFRSDRLTKLDQNPVSVWTAPDTGWNRSNVWAPELKFLNGRWYIYYAAGRSGPPFTSQRTGVLESEGEDPQGGYVDRGQLYTGDDIAGKTNNRWAIDFTVGEIGGQLYGFWSGWDGDAPDDKSQNQNLYAARLANPYTVATSRVRISQPDQPWEDNPPDVGFDLQEGPEVLQRNGQTFIVYSTRESWMPNYRLGLLRLTNPAAVLDPASYAKSTGPVFSSANGVFGVGHNGFTTSPDGTQDWLVYHAKTSTNPGWGDRVIRMQPFTFRADGTPDFGQPAAAPLPKPSGEPCGS